MARYAFLIATLFALGACTGPRIEAANPDSVTVYTGAPNKDFAGALRLAEEHCGKNARKPIPASQIAASGHINAGHYVTYRCVP